MTAAARALAALLLAAAPALAAENYREPFSAAAEHALLRDLPGWGLYQDGKGAAELSIAAGYEGMGARLSGNEQYRRRLGAGEAQSVAASPEFRCKLRVMAPSDAYAQVQVLVGRDDGIHGLAIRFQGGKQDGSQDNVIQVSDGGVNWGRVHFTDCPGSAWKKETWYEIVLGPIRDEDGRVTARLVVREAGDGGAVLVDGQTAAATGGTFGAIDVVIVGNVGTDRAFHLDDLSLVTPSAP